MSGDWVVNASPLIALGKANGLDLLSGLCGRVLVPAAVWREVEAGPADDPARRFLASPIPQRIDDPPPPPASLLQWGLGPGETAVIAARLGGIGSMAVLDDALARRAARSFGVSCIGTVGIVLRAAKQGLIPSAPRMFGQLRSAGLYLDESLIQQVLSDLNLNDTQSQQR